MKQENFEIRVKKFMDGKLQISSWLSIVIVFLSTATTTSSPSFSAELPFPQS
jgi:hypothetical protein